MIVCELPYSRLYVRGGWVRGERGVLEITKKYPKRESTAAPLQKKNRVQSFGRPTYPEWRGNDSKTSLFLP